MHFETSHAGCERLGLHALQPEDVVRDVAADTSLPSDAGWLKHLWSRFLQVDIFAGITKDDRLIQLHSSAEPLDACSEGLFHQSLVISSFLPADKTCHHSIYCTHSTWTWLVLLARSGSKCRIHKHRLSRGGLRRLVACIQSDVKLACQIQGVMRLAA